MKMKFDPLWILDNIWAFSKFGQGVKIEWVGSTGANVERFLRGYGVRVWGRQISYKVGEPWGVRVPANQAAYADALLRVKGYAVTSPHLGKKFNKVPRPWGVPAKPVGFVGVFVRNIGGDLDPANDEGWGNAPKVEKRGSVGFKMLRKGNTRREGSRPRKTPENGVTRARGAYRRGV